LGEGIFEDARVDFVVLIGRDDGIPQGRLDGGRQERYIFCIDLSLCKSVEILRTAAVEDIGLIDVHFGDEEIGGEGVEFGEGE
jgi:hypothetical protein